MEEYQPNPEVRAETQQRLAAYLAMPVKGDLDPAERAALDRLIIVALRGTGQSRIVADFLLSWWNSSECGAFDPTELWGLDKEIGEDVCLIFRAIASIARYPDALGYEKQFDRMVRLWRPRLFANDDSDVQRRGVQISI